VRYTAIIELDGQDDVGVARALEHAGSGFGFRLLSLEPFPDRLVPQSAIQTGEDGEFMVDGTRYRLKPEAGGWQSRSSGSAIWTVVTVADVMRAIGTTQWTRRYVRIRTRGVIETLNLSARARLHTQRTAVERHGLAHGHLGLPDTLAAEDRALVRLRERIDALQSELEDALAPETGR
jgi:hypothetical protein